MGLVTEGGMLAVVIPSGLLTNEGAKDLRKALLQMRILSIYEFENRGKIFPEVDSRYKFVLLIASNKQPTPEFKAAFYLHDIKSLHGKTEQDKFLSMPTELIRLTSPEVLAISEVRSSRDVEILSSVYANHGCVRDGLDNGKYTISFIREFDRTNDSRLFRRDGKGWPLIEGKNFHQFIPDYSQPEFSIPAKEGLSKTQKIKAYRDKNKQVHNTTRLVFRNIASPTNIRTMISCIVHSKNFLAHSCSTVVLSHNGIPTLDREYHSRILYLLAIFNSMTFDYLIRLRSNMNLTFFIINSIAIPQNTKSKLAQRIIKLSGMLTIQNDDFADMAESLEHKTKKLNIQERIKITAELDALVAHHYKLDRDQYEYIISTFKPKKPNGELDDSAEWNDNTIHAINYEVKTMALSFYDGITIDT